MAKFLTARIVPAVGGWGEDAERAAYRLDPGQYALFIVPQDYADILTMVINDVKEASERPEPREPEYECTIDGCPCGDWPTELECDICGEHNCEYSQSDSLPYDKSEPVECHCAGPKREDGSCMHCGGID